MKISAWEAAPQIALRNCSKGAVGGKSIYKVLVKTEFSTVCSLVSKESASNAGDPGSIPRSGRSPGEGNGKVTPVFLPGESYGQRSLAGYSPWGRKSWT